MSTLIIQGLKSPLLVTEGYASGAEIPHFPFDPSIITQGFVGLAGAIFVQGYHLGTSGPAITVCPDPFAATADAMLDPFQTTGTSLVDPFAGTVRRKGS